MRMYGIKPQQFACQVKPYYLFTPSNSVSIRFQAAAAYCIKVLKSLTRAEKMLAWCKSLELGGSPCLRTRYVGSLPLGAERAQPGLQAVGGTDPAVLPGRSSLGSDLSAAADGTAPGR